MENEFESMRRTLAAETNSVKGDRELLEAKHGKVWDTDELARDFDVLGFMAPFIVVKRKDNGDMGSLQFQHSPRFYFGYKKDR